MLSTNTSEKVHYYEHDHGGIIMLDTASGCWIALNLMASEYWRNWSAGKGLDQTVVAVAARHPDVPLAAVRADAKSLLAQLTARGLIGAVPAKSAPRAVVGSGVAMAESEFTVGEGRFRSKLRSTVAFICIVLASVVVRRSLRIALWLVSTSRRGWCRANPDLGAARRTVAAVSRAARLYPGRSACLELSLAAVLLAAVRRRRLDWCFGSAANPYQFHAWVELDGRAVPVPGRPADEVGYLRVLAV